MAIYKTSLHVPKLLLDHHQHLQFFQGVIAILRFIILKLAIAAVYSIDTTQLVAKLHTFQNVNLIAMRQSSRKKALATVAGTRALMYFKEDTNHVVLRTATTICTSMHPHGVCEKPAMHTSFGLQSAHNHFILTELIGQPLVP